MTDLPAREMEMSAELVCERIWKHPDLEPLRAAGVQVMMGHRPTAVWLDARGNAVARLDWIRWCDAGLDTREDHAAIVAHRLVKEWKSAGAKGLSMVRAEARWTGTRTLRRG